MDSESNGNSPSNRQKENALETMRRQIILAHARNQGGADSSTVSASVRGKYSDVEEGEERRMEVRHASKVIQPIRKEVVPEVVSSMGAVTVPAKLEKNPEIKLDNVANVARAVPETKEVVVPKIAGVNVEVAAEKPKSEQKKSVSAEDLQKYHAEWQKYYQKYYNEHYSKAATDYIKTEKTKLSKQALAVAKGGEISGLDDQNIDLEFREYLQNKASDEAYEWKLRKRKKRLPLIIGLVLVFGVLFLEYHRHIVAPVVAYMSPGNIANTEITEIDPTISKAPNNDPKLIIPKINVEVPVHFGIANDTATIDRAMENGVAHFSFHGADGLPGRFGNTIITGHSAGNIYAQSNQYQFIFSGLERMELGDKFYINYEGTRYTYNVVQRKVIEPSDLDALRIGYDKKYATLLTCTPLGTSRQRLLIIAEQINPAPEQNDTPGGGGELPGGNDAPEELPKNSPTFFEGIWNFLTGRS